jgi:hypothetical protein
MKNVLLMRAILWKLKCLLLVMAITGYGQAIAQGREDATVDTTLSSVQHWFEAWELISTDVYGLDTLEPVDFLFFDETNMYTTSKEAGKGGISVNGPAFFGRECTWLKRKQHGKISLPDGQEIPIGLLSFAMPLPSGEAHSLFIMPLPAYWKMQGIESKELGIDHLLTGVFLHEFSHSQQMQFFGKRMSEFEAIYTDTLEFTDNLIQEYFEHDTGYTNLFRKEISSFYFAATSQNKKALQANTHHALQALQKRQAKYFTGPKQSLIDIDNFFLTMEGVGQYSMYAWLIHSKGANIKKDLALRGVRRGGRYWSQDEGLGIMLLLSEWYTPKQWATWMFGKHAYSAISLLEEKMKSDLIE